MMYSLNSKMLIKQEPCSSKQCESYHRMGNKPTKPTYKQNEKKLVIYISFKQKEYGL